MKLPTTRPLICILMFAAAVMAVPKETYSAEPELNVSQWNGFERLDFEVNGRKCWIVRPKQAAETKPWVWRARFFGHEPQADLALLNCGYHLAYCDVAGLFGSPRAVAHWDAFYQFATEKLGLSKKVALEGMSRGGLIIYNWSAKNPSKVACIYGDAPVCDVRSWPGGQGNGKGAPGAWKQCLQAYRDAGVDENDIVGPLDHLDVLAKSNVPLLHVVGDADEVVPVAENTALLEKAYRKLGGSIQVIHKSGVGHHPHSLKDPSPIVRFIRRYCEPNVQSRGSFQNSAFQFQTQKSGTVAFIGGSITQMDGYRPMVCKNLQQRFPDTEFQFINAGVASTCSTTGAFRIDAEVLAAGRVDLLFVEFAVNDDQDANHSSINCVRGMEGILRRARDSNPNMDIVVTYFVNPGMLNAIDRGETPKSIAAHQKVVQHYGVSSIHLAKEVAERIADETLTWEIYGGVHPKPAGNQIAAEMIESLLSDAWSESATQLRPHTVPGNLLDANSYVSGIALPLEQAELQSGWEIRVPDWANIKGSKRQMFLDRRMLCASEAGSELSVSFRGTALGAYLLAGPDAGRLGVRIDGGDEQSFELKHRHSRSLHYPRTIMFAADLDDGDHVATVRLLAAPEGEEQGVARLLRLVVNGELPGNVSTKVEDQ